LLTKDKIPRPDNPQKMSQIDYELALMFDHNRTRTMAMVVTSATIELFLCVFFNIFYKFEV